MTCTALTVIDRAPGYREEVRNRSVRVKNLPPNTQEGLLQQALEKHAKIKRVEVFAEINEAELELESPAVSQPPGLISFPCTHIVARTTGGWQATA